MKLVNDQLTKKMINELFAMFGLDEKKVKKYIRAKTFTIGPINFIRCFPNLWYPQNKKQKYMEDIFESIVEMNGRQNEIGDEKINKVREELSKYLESKEIKKIYAAGESMRFNNEWTTNLIEMSPKEIPDFFKKCNFGFEMVLFPPDLSWLFGFTHEFFFYLAGSKKFVDGFKKSFPEYKNYKLEHTMVKKTNF